MGADCLGNGGRPPSRSCALRKPPPWERLESPFCLWHCASPNALSLGFPGLAHCPSPVQSQVQPSQVSVSQFNRAPVTVRFCMERCGVPLYSGASQPHQLLATPAKTFALCPASLLYVGISPFCGQLRFVWKCVPDSPSLPIQQELQSWVVLTVPS